MVDAYFRMWEDTRLIAEKYKLRAPPPRSTKPIEPKPRPTYQRDEKSNRLGFTQAFVDETRGGRFAKIDQLINDVDVPRQPAGSPWHHDPLGDEPALGFSVERPGYRLEEASPPVIKESTAREEELEVDIDILTEIIERQKEEIARLKAELETQSSVAAPVTSAVADVASTGGEQVELPDPLSADFSSSAQQKE
jgi:hypothetical protein